MFVSHYSIRYVSARMMFHVGYVRTRLQCDYYYRPLTLSSQPSLGRYVEINAGGVIIAFFLAIRANDQRHCWAKHVPTPTPTIICVYTKHPPPCFGTAALSTLKLVGSSTAGRLP